MFRYIFFIASLVGALSLRAQDLTLSYATSAGTDGTTVLEVFMTNHRSDPMQIGAMNLSVMTHANQAIRQDVWSVFGDDWGGNLENLQEIRFNRSYLGNQYDQRFQYGNTSANLSAPASIDLPAAGHEPVSVMRLSFQTNSKLEVYMEDLSENPMNEIADLMGEPIEYEILNTFGQFPVSWVDAQAYQSAENANTIEWMTQNEFNTDHFVVEFSLDAIKYETVGKVDSKADVNGNGVYRFRHGKLDPANVSYRIRQVDAQGNIFYSDIMQVEMSTEFGYFVNLYPNPATTTELTLESSHPESLQYQLNLLDLNGRVLRSVSSIELGAVDHQLNVSGLAAGVYVIELTERQSGERLTKPFVKIAE